MNSPAQGRRSLSLPKAVGALFIAVIGSARGRWFPRFFSRRHRAPITSPPMRAIGVPQALTFATGGRKGVATQSGNALRCRPRSAARLFVLCVFRLNANPAFSVRANVSGNILIHRAVGVPPFWRALSKPAAPRTTMGDAFAKRNEHNGGRSRPLGLRSQRLY